MSDLLSQASLVMIPSGYKEDVVYSVVPSDGSGDLSFTRASNGTRVNSAGLVEVVPWNLASYSEEFNNTSGWTQDPNGGSITITANYGVAPNGTTTADRIQITKGPNYSQVYQTSSVISGAVYTVSVYLKSLSGTPTITTLYDSIAKGTQTLTTEWVRYEFSFTASSGTIYPMIALYFSDSASMDVLAWGYQLNIGATAKPYFPTTDRLNVPRLTYQNGGGGCPSLLLEKQSTNLALYSEQFDNASWNATNTTISANATISPDGTQNADNSVTVSSNGTLGRSFSISANTETYTQSIYVKWVSGYESFMIRTALIGGTSVSGFTIINCKTGVVISSDTTNKIESVGNGWFRLSHQLANNGTNTTYIYQIYNTLDTAQTQTISLWGAQVEASSYPTSYIPTTSSSATRVADACFKTGISSLIGQTEGTLFVDIVTPTAIPSGAEILPISIFQSGGGTGGVQAYIAFLSNGVVRFVYFDGALQALITTASGFWSAGNRYKLAAVYKQNDFAFYINGVQIGTDNSGNVSAMADFYLDYQGSVQQNTVNQCALFKTRLSNSDLIALTTI